MSEVLYKQALAVTAVMYRVLPAGESTDKDVARLRRKALALPQQVKRLLIEPRASDLVRLRSDLADFRQWLEDQAAAGAEMPMADFDLLAGRLSRGLTTLKPPRPGS